MIASTLPLLAAFLSLGQLVSSQNRLISTYAGNNNQGCSYSGPQDATSPSFTMPRVTGVHFAMDGTGYYTSNECGFVLQHNPTTNIVSKFAGTGYGSYQTGDGGAAVSANISAVQSSYSSAYNTDIFLCGNGFVRKVELSTGKITKYAGTYTSSSTTNYIHRTVGQYGDGGPATSAVLDQCGGIWVNGTNHVFISDLYSALRVITPGGLIYRYSGSYSVQSYLDGPINTALWNQPGHLWGNADTIYVSDTGNCLIRRLDLNSGIVNIVTGQRGTCTYTGDDGPAGLATTKTTGNHVKICGQDAFGTLFFTEEYSAVVRSVDPVTGTISRFAGQYDWEWNGDFIQATSAMMRMLDGSGCALKDDEVYVADGGAVYGTGNRIRHVWNSIGFPTLKPTVVPTVPVPLPTAAPSAAPSFKTECCDCFSPHSQNPVQTKTKVETWYDPECRANYTVTTITRTRWTNDINF